MANVGQMNSKSSKNGSGSFNVPMVLFWTLLVALSSVHMMPYANAATAQPIYLYGNQVTIKVYPTGSYNVNPMDFPSRFSDSSSFWSFNIDGKVSTTYNPKTIDHMLTPTRSTADGAIRVQYLLEKEVLVDITYRDAGPSAWITVTFLNLGPGPHTVGARYLYDLVGKNLITSGGSLVTTETTFTAPSFERMDIFEGPQQIALVPLGGTYGTTEPTRVTIGSWDTTWNQDWEYKANSSVSVETQPTMIIYWENMNLPGKGFVKVEHAFGTGAPTIVQNALDLSITNMIADPDDQYISKIRTIRATVMNKGPAVNNIEVQFMIADDTGRYVMNGSVSRSIASGTTIDISWPYTVKKLIETKAYAIVDPSQDMAPNDNVASVSIVAHPFPYKVMLKFPDETRIRYISINSGDKTSCNVVVSNLGTIVDNITMSFSAIPDKWSASFNSSSVSLRPGTSAQVKITIKTVKNNKYYNYGLDIIGRSQDSTVSDKVLIFISFEDIIAKNGGNSSRDQNRTNGTNTHQPPTNNTTPLIPTPPGTGIDLNGSQLALLFVMFGVAFIGAIAIYQIYLVRSKIGMSGILKNFYKKLYDANTSDAYRKAIYKAYTEMCEELAGHGHERAESLTPKEFEREIRNYLPIDKKNLHILTKLFEEARYSDHSFNEANKQQALVALEGIINSLENVTTFEEVKEKSWFGKNT